VVNSPLVKTAIFGKDPNWGRVAMAIGKCFDDTAIDQHHVSIAFGDILVYAGKDLGEAMLPQLEAYLAQDSVQIHVSLALGSAQATVWGCDLSYEYVRINGEYTT
jgi:glutamate N-acetyltransferase/amino-acid N-acetyltransferase